MVRRGRKRTLEIGTRRGEFVLRESARRQTVRCGHREDLLRDSTSRRSAGGRFGYAGLIPMPKQTPGSGRTRAPLPRMQLSGWAAGRLWEHLVVPRGGRSRSTSRLFCAVCPFLEQGDDLASAGELARAARRGWVGRRSRERGYAGLKGAREARICLCVSESPNAHDREVFDLPCGRSMMPRLPPSLFGSAVTETDRLAITLHAGPGDSPVLER